MLNKTPQSKVVISPCMLKSVCFTYYFLLILAVLTEAAAAESVAGLITYPHRLYGSYCLFCFSVISKQVSDLTKETLLQMLFTLIRALFSPAPPPENTFPYG